MAVSCLDCSLINAMSDCRDASVATGSIRSGRRRATPPAPTADAACGLGLGLGLACDCIGCGWRAADAADAEDAEDARSGVLHSTSVTGACAASDGFCGTDLDGVAMVVAAAVAVGRCTA